MASVTLRHTDGTVETVEFVESEMSLGSKPENDLQIKHTGVSRKHARIFREGGEFVLEDLGSSTFVFVHGQAVTRHVFTGPTEFGLGDEAKLLFLPSDDPDRLRLFAGLSSPTGELPGDPSETERAHAQLETLFEVGASINSSLELEVVLQTILDRALTLTRADRGLLMLLDEDKLVPRVMRNINEGDQDVTFSGSFARKAIDRGETLVSTNVLEDMRYRSASILAHNIYSIMCAPLRFRDTVLGCLYVDVRQATLRFARRDASTFTALANQASIAIHNARINEDLRRSLKESENLYELSRLLGSGRSFEETLHICVERTRSILGTTFGIITIERRLAWDVRLVVSGNGLDVAKVEQPGDSLKNLFREAAAEPLLVEDATSLGIGVEGQDPPLKVLVARLASDRGHFGYFLAGTTDPQIRLDEGHRRVFESLASLATLCLERHDVHQETLRQERLQREMDDARKVQQLLLPRVVPGLSGWDIAAKYVLANKVGGDYYDFIENEDGHLAIVVADVSGHDIASAIVMSMARNLIRTFLKNDRSPASVLSKTSLALQADIHSERYVSAFLGILDPATRNLVYSNGGNQPPLLLKQGSHKFQVLEAGGCPLGLLDDHTFTEESIELAEQDLLLVFTDGLIEAQSETRGFYELDRFQNLALQLRGAATVDLVETVYTRVIEFTGTDRLDDDFTLVALKGIPHDGTFVAQFRSVLSSIDAEIATILDRPELHGSGVDRVSMQRGILAAVKNAVEHGNNYDPTRSVYVRVKPSPGEVTIQITDEGDGFDASKAAPGSGFEIIRARTAEVSWSDAGNSISMKFR